MKPQEVFIPSAAAIYLRQTYLDAGGFDPACYSHHEDFDLGFRLLQADRRCLYVPDEIVEHVGSASFRLKSDLAFYQYQRNFVWSYLNNMPGGLLWHGLPAHLLANLVMMDLNIRRDQGRAVLRAKWDSLRGLPPIHRQRSLIQQKN